MPRPASEFIRELIELCEKHQMTIGHEDNYGSFLIEDYYEANLNSLLTASNETTSEDDVSENKLIKHHPKFSAPRAR